MHRKNFQAKKKNFQQKKIFQKKKYSQKITVLLQHITFQYFWWEFECFEG
jgi:hypothetical protein